MAVDVINFTTGPSTLPDVGTLSYNGCIFSPLFATSISGIHVKDNANRTVKYMEYTLTADGYVTLPTGHSSINTTTRGMRELLEAQAGELVYRGRGFDLIIGPSTSHKDAVWGPVPEVLDFQPLGTGKSAKIKWQVKVRLPKERLSQSESDLLQFNAETVVTYNEDGFSFMSVKGTMEIPLTRTGRQTNRTLTNTVDDFRNELNARIFNGIDDTRFRTVRRDFNISRDKRTMEFDVLVEEKPYMDMPPDCFVARGTYSVRPARSGMGLCNWLCTLRATYTIRADRPRRTAWLAFLALLRLRMAEAEFGNVVPLAADENEQNPGVSGVIRVGIAAAIDPRLGTAAFWSETLRLQNRLIVRATKALLIDFSFDEGLYLDSKTTSFSATWRIITTFSHILIASGLWKKVPERTQQGENVWALSMRDVTGATTYLPNFIDPTLDVIVDFGGP